MINWSIYILPICLLNIGHIKNKKIKNKNKNYVYWNHILFFVLSKISNGNALPWNDGEKMWNHAHDITSEIDFCFIYPDFVIFLEAESNLTSA